MAQVVDCATVIRDILLSGTGVEEEGEVMAKGIRKKWFGDWVYFGSGERRPSEEDDSHPDYLPHFDTPEEAQAFLWSWLTHLAVEFDDADWLLQEPRDGECGTLGVKLYLTG